MSTPNTLPANGGVSDDQVRSAVANMHLPWSKNNMTTMRRVLEGFLQSRPPSTQSGERVELPAGCRLVKDYITEVRQDPAMAARMDAVRAGLAPPPAGGGKEALSDAERLKAIDDFASKVVRFGETSDVGMFSTPNSAGIRAMDDDHINVQFMVRGNFGTADALFDAIRPIIAAQAGKKG